MTDLGEERNYVATADATLDKIEDGVAGQTPRLSTTKLTDRERQRHNLKVALALAKAGVAVFPSLNKTPQPLRWQKLDATLDANAKAIAKAEYDEKRRKAGKPLRTPFYYGCTHRAHIVEQLWLKCPDAVTSISCGPSGLIVVDADLPNEQKPNAANGPAAIAALFAEHNVNLTYVPIVESQSGARHFYFSNPDQLGGRRFDDDRWNTHIKGDGGQTVAPGSIREDGKRYSYVPGSPTLIEAVTAGTLPPIPPCIVALMGAKSPSGKDRDPEIQATLDELESGASDVLTPFDYEVLKTKDAEFRDVVDDPSSDHSDNRYTVAKCLQREFGRYGFTVHHLAAFYDDYEGAGSFVESGPRQGEFHNRAVAREFVNAKGSAPVTTGEAFGDVSVAGAVANVSTAVCLGIGEGDAIAALEAALDNDGADDATATKALLEARKFSEGDNSAGDRLRRLFGIAPRSEPVEAPKPTKKGRNIRRAADRMAPLAPVEYLVSELMMRGDIVVADGAPGIGKSVALLHLSICIATGRPFFGRETEQGPALYFGPENPDEENRRFQANLKHYGLSAEIPHFFDSETFRLVGPKNDVKSIIEAARAIKADTGQPCKLIVLDNARRALGGNSEKDDQYVVVLMLACEAIRNATGAAVILLAHTIRNGSRLSGSGVFESHSDSVWHFDEDRGRPIITFEKLRAGNKRQVLRFRTTTESVTVDKAGKPINTVVAVDTGSLAGVDLKVEDEAAEVAEPSREDKGDGREAMAIDEAKRLTLEFGTFNIGALHDAFAARRKADGLPDLGLRTLQRTVQTLVAFGQLVITGPGKGSKAAYRWTETQEFEAAAE